MKILITGVTGFIGWSVFQALRARGHRIVASVRDPMLVQVWLKNAEIIRADFTHDCEVKDWLPHLRDIDVVINTVGIIQDTAIK
jgi:nucleoside-diphosphate-sugar epimerase